MPGAPASQTQGYTWPSLNTASVSQPQLHRSVLRPYFPLTRTLREASLSMTTPISSPTVRHARMTSVT